MLVPSELVYALRERARIRRTIQSRKSVQEGVPDRLAIQLEDAADLIEHLVEVIERLKLEGKGSER